MPEENKIAKVIGKLELVQQVGSAKENWLKVSGEDVMFACPKDEFSRYLITLIPEFYKWLKAFANNGDSDVIEKLRKDLKDYLNHKETLLGVYLNESDCAKLLEGDKNA